MQFSQVVAAVRPKITNRFNDDIPTLYLAMRYPPINKTSYPQLHEDKNMRVEFPTISL